MSKFSGIRTLVKVGVVPASLIISGALVWQSSYAAFSSTTVNPTNNWTAGSVVLSDDDSTTAMFTATSLKPGMTGSKCIVVTSAGTLAATVKLYSTTYSTSNALSSYIDLVIEEGSGGAFSDCTGFSADATAFTGTLETFGTTKTNFSNGVSAWAPSGGGSETKTYKITYTINASTPNSVQAGTAAAGLTWESQTS